MTRGANTTETIAQYGIVASMQGMINAGGVAFDTAVSSLYDEGRS